MQQLVILCAQNCGYCKKVKMLMKRALEKEPIYAALDIHYIDENSEEGKKYPHLLVPAIFCSGVLLFEGNPRMEDIMTALRRCYDR